MSPIKPQKPCNVYLYVEPCTRVQSFTKVWKLGEV